MKTLHCFPLFVVLLLCASTATGQAIPIDIPDTPGESPADRERQKNEERHHAKLSRVFGTTSFIAAPALNRHGLVFDTILEAGVELRHGDAFYIMIGARNAPALSEEERYWNDVRESAQLLAMGYDIGLARFASMPILANSALGIAAGGWFGDVNVFTVDVTPRYLFRASSFWTFPVGLKFSSGFVGSNADAVTLIGISFGVRRHFGQRRSLE